jgi:hypothetical protein
MKLILTASPFTHAFKRRRVRDSRGRHRRAIVRVAREASVVIGDDACFIRTDRGGACDGGCDETTRIVFGACARLIWGPHAVCARFDSRGDVVVGGGGGVVVATRDGDATERAREISADDGDAAERGRDSVDERRRGRRERERREDEGGARTERDDGKVG